MRIFRDYQSQDIDKIFQRNKDGIQSMIEVLATGLGKTVVASGVIERFREQINPKARTLWITHTEELIEQSALSVLNQLTDAKYEDDIKVNGGVMNILTLIKKQPLIYGHLSEVTQTIGIIKQERCDLDCMVSVASIQTLYRRLSHISKNYFDLIVVDECFPAGTKVDGKNIEDIKPGDYVNSYNHELNIIEEKKVLRVMTKSPSSLLQIKLSNNSIINCTKNHPFYTANYGYIPALMLHLCQSTIDTIYSVIENDTNLCNLPNGIQTKTSQFQKYCLLLSALRQKGNSAPIEKADFDRLLYMWYYHNCSRKERNYIIRKTKNWYNCLLAELLRYSKEKWTKESGRNEKKQYDPSDQCFRKNEEQQSNVKSNHKTENDKFYERTDISFSWWKWKNNKATISALSSNWFSNGICNTNSRSKKYIPERSESLQSGFSISRNQVSNRSGWGLTQTEEMEISRQTENRNIKFLRVESSKILESGSRSDFRKVCRNNTVYNIEVEGNNNYFVEGILVHNCHYAMAKSWQDSINYFDKKLLLGLTATPERLDGVSLNNLFEEIVSDRDIKFGIDNGYLVPIEGVRVQTDLNLNNIDKTAGDLNIGQLENLLNTPQRNKLIVEKYIEYCKGKQFICFAVDIKHAIDLTNAFREAGLNVDYVISDEKLCPDRESRISLFKSGELLGLINVMILTAGFDYDMVECIITARPTMSKTVYLQQIGRGTRTQSGILNGLDELSDRMAAIAASRKQKLIILDIVDNTNKHSLINTWTLDKDKEPEDMVFVSEAKRKDLLKEKQERKTKLNHTQKQDDKVNLLTLPTAKKYYMTKEQMQSPATPAQLAWLERRGFDIVNNFYTKAMASEVLSNMQATQRQINALARYGYDVSKGVSNAVAKEAFEEIHSGAQIKRILKNKNNIKSFEGLK